MKVYSKIDTDHNNFYIEARLPRVFAIEDEKEHAVLRGYVFSVSHIHKKNAPKSCKLTAKQLKARKDIIRLNGKFYYMSFNPLFGVNKYALTQSFPNSVPDSVARYDLAYCKKCRSFQPVIQVLEDELTGKRCLSYVSSAICGLTLDEVYKVTPSRHHIVHLLCCNCKEHYDMNKDWVCLSFHKDGVYNDDTANVLSIYMENINCGNYGIKISICSNAFKLKGVPTLYNRFNERLTLDLEEGRIYYLPKVDMSTNTGKNRAFEIVSMTSDGHSVLCDYFSNKRETYIPTRKLLEITRKVKRFYDDRYPEMREKTVDDLLKGVDLNKDKHPLSVLCRLTLLPLVSEEVFEYLIYLSLGESYTRSNTLFYSDLVIRKEKIIVKKILRNAIKKRTMTDEEILNELGLTRDEAIIIVNEYSVYAAFLLKWYTGSSELYKQYIRPLGNDECFTISLVNRHKQHIASLINPNNNTYLKACIKYFKQKYGMSEKEATCRFISVLFNKLEEQSYQSKAVEDACVADMVLAVRKIICTFNFKSRYTSISSQTRYLEDECKIKNSKVIAELIEQTFSDNYDEFIKKSNDYYNSVNFELRIRNTQGTRRLVDNLPTVVNNSYAEPVMYKAKLAQSTKDLVAMSKATGRRCNEDIVEHVFSNSLICVLIVNNKEEICSVMVYIDNKSKPGRWYVYMNPTYFDDNVLVQFMLDSFSCYGLEEHMISRNRSVGYTYKNIPNNFIKDIIENGNNYNCIRDILLCKQSN